MNRIWKFFQYGYLIVALMFLAKGFSHWDETGNKSYLCFGFAFLIILVFFFKRHFRKKVEKRNNLNK